MNSRNFLYPIFLSAFLLFLVQPMIARFILPWYGGTSAVWSTCMLFFQTGLLVGYGYSHFITRKLSLHNQLKLHLALLILSVITLPVIPKEWMKMNETEDPVFGILRLLTLTAGFPYIMVSSTGPLLQHWYSNANPKKSPYRLYALSNLGSLIGLFIYPLLIEPSFNLKNQAWFWTAGYLLFILLCGILAKELYKLKPVIISHTKKVVKKISTQNKIMWLLLSLMGTTILLSITNILTQEIIVIPFLWIIPLSMYLISFIIAFDSPRWYNRKVFVPLMLLLLFFIIKNLLQATNNNDTLSVTGVITLYSFSVFIICMTLHGELARQKPDEGNLTAYYLFIAIGGVLGGIFINLIVPMIFNGAWEIYIALAGSILLTGISIGKEQIIKKKSVIPAYTFTIVVVVGILFAFYTDHSVYGKSTLASSRNFYGILKVTEEKKNTPGWQRTMVHGNIVHGVQLMDSIKSFIPFTYYTPESGIGLALTRYPTRAEANYQGMKVGMIGLGTGTISTYGTVKDTYKYYELNPQVEILAKKYFRNFINYKGKSEVILGDGRISLENELKKSGSNQFDVLAVDAFSGDAIPVHLLTMQALDLYFNNLKPDGILAFNITNNYIDLLPVMCGIGEKFNKQVYYFIQNASAENPVSALWVLFTDNTKFLKDPEVANRLQVYDFTLNPRVYWTDDYAPIWPLFR